MSDERLEDDARGVVDHMSALEASDGGNVSAVEAQVIRETVEDLLRALTEPAGKAVAWLALFQIESMHGDSWEQDGVYPTREAASSAASAYVHRFGAGKAVVLPCQVIPGGEIKFRRPEPDSEEEEGDATS